GHLFASAITGDEHCARFGSIRGSSQPGASAQCPSPSAGPKLIIIISSRSLIAPALVRALFPLGSHSRLAVLSESAKLSPLPLGNGQERASRGRRSTRPLSISIFCCCCGIPPSSARSHYSPHL